MELRQYWELLRRRWWLPVGLMLLTAFFSAIQLKPWQTPVPSYHVSLRMLIGVSPQSTTDSTAFDTRYYAWLTSEYLVDDFTEVVRSSLFAQNVSKRLAAQQIEIPANVIQGSAVSSKQHRIITLSFSWGERNQLEAVADAVEAELTENAHFYFEQLGSNDSLVKLLDSPTISESTPSLRGRIEFPLRVILGLVVGLGIAFLLDYLDLSVRNRQELEAIGLTVLGEIPRE
ncbi:MAG: hypothetical protein U0175_09175 [Caldilineaceae bacterium]